MFVSEPSGSYYSLLLCFLIRNRVEQPYIHLSDLYMDWLSMKHLLALISLELNASSLTVMQCTQIAIPHVTGANQAMLILGTGASFSSNLILYTLADLKIKNQKSLQGL